MLRKILCELTRGGAGKASADKLFEICKPLAQVFLSSQYWSLRSVPGHSRQIEDLACDFVADIFERDESGYYPQIARFFSDLAIEVVPEEVLLSELRRLVFNKVRDNLYRYQKAHDPGLHRIIRGLKIACTEAGDLHHKNGSIVLENDATRGKPEISFELLEIKLCRILKRHQSIRNVLQELMQMLVDQQEHSPRIELIQLAMAIRNVEFYLETEVTDAAQDDILPGPNELESFAVMAGQKVMDKLGLVSPLGILYLKREQSDPIGGARSMARRIVIIQMVYRNKMGYQPTVMVLANAHIRIVAIKKEMRFPRAPMYPLRANYPIRYSSMPRFW
jgi:hypothetical protein